MYFTDESKISSERKEGCTMYFTDTSKLVSTKDQSDQANVAEDDEYVKPSMTWVYIILSFMWILGYLLIIFTTCKLFNDQQQKEKREQQIAQAHV